ncbi:MAG: ABC transporter substrate-binding protein [Ilumatobacter sp.]|uniref:ABC transporter substrate-binding protein n=1 Tax=Ilumatobacter sp. TaxID=1967498 RepID=UPI003C72138E
MKKHSIKLAAVPVALALVAGACGSDSESSSSDEPDTEVETDTTDATADEGDAEASGDMDFGGQEILITGSERDDPSVAAINFALDQFEERANVSVEFVGDADWETNINTQVEGGNPPDISFFPQPGKLRDFAADDFIVPLSDGVNAAIDEYWAESYQADGQTEDGTQYGVPAKTDLKSVVWYQPARFEEAGYEIPETFEEFQALVDEMAAADGPAPLCVGIESGAATGWTFTDWTEEMVLRQHGPEVYDQWVSHEIPFNDPRIVESMDTVVQLWSDDNVFASSGSIVATNFADNAEPLVAGDCFMHRQANFFGGFFPAGQAFADESDPDSVDVFYFPDIDGSRPVLTAGTLAAAFNDDEATMAVLEFIASAEYAEIRQAEQTAQLDGAISGFLSAAQGQDESVYQPLEQNFLSILADAEVSRFDGSDLMPSSVGAGSFWTEATSLVNGDIDAQEAADRIEDSWPAE